MNLVVMGCHRSADGHGFAVNPYRLKVCGFIADDTRRWAPSFAEIIGGICQGPASHVVAFTDEFTGDPVIRWLCEDHAAHMASCPDCLSWCPPLEPVPR